MATDVVLHEKSLDLIGEDAIVLTAKAVKLNTPKSCEISTNSLNIVGKKTIINADSIFSVQTGLLQLLADDKLTAITHDMQLTVNSFHLYADYAKLSLPNIGFVSLDTVTLTDVQFEPVADDRVSIELAAELSRLRAEIVLVRQLLFQYAFPAIEELNEKLGKK